MVATPYLPRYSSASRKRVLLSKGLFMRISDYGPVPISKLKHESREMFDALAEGSRVLISRRGLVVAEIRPPTEGDAHLLASFALPADEATPLAQLTSTTINQSASRTITEVLESDGVAFVTNAHSVLGFLERYEAEKDELSVDDHKLINSRVAAFLAKHPDATAQDVADYQAERESAIVEAGGNQTSTLLDRARALAMAGVEVSADSGLVRATVQPKPRVSTVSDATRAEATA